MFKFYIRDNINNRFKLNSNVVNMYLLYKSSIYEVVVWNGKIKSELNN